MTVNERRFILGLLADFDAAARRRDERVMLELLRRTELSEADAQGHVAAILADPARFGFQ
jgi:hypothetical protein